MRLPFRLLALDIDGTLLNSQFEISSADIASLRRVHECGSEVILCTGRRHTFALPIAQRLGFDLWLCTSNGAVTRSSTGEEFHREFLPAAIARSFCSHMADFRGGMVLTFDQDSKGALVVEDLDELSQSVSRWVTINRDYIKHCSPIEKALERDPIQAMVCGSIDRMKAAEEHLNSFTQLDSITVLKTEYEARDLCLLDVLNHGCSKGHAVERWANHRRIPREEIMAIGDNFNDIEMLEFAGIPVVMANASHEMKRSEWLLTLSNDQSGVTAAIVAVESGSWSVRVPDIP